MQDKTPDPAPDAICIHGGLRRQCEACDLADRLEAAEARVQANWKMHDNKHGILRLLEANDALTARVQELEASDRALATLLAARMERVQALERDVARLNNGATAECPACGRLYEVRDGKWHLIIGDGHA